MISQCSAKNHLGCGPSAVLIECVAVLEDRLHVLVVVDAAQPEDAVLESSWRTSQVCDVPVLHSLLEATTHHLWSAISRDVFWDVPGCKEVSHNSDQVLAVKLA